MTLLHYSPPMHPYLSLLYRDDDIVVVNKPSGLLSVPGKERQHHDSTYSRVLTVLPTARVVHRLDMATSGIVLFALNKTAQAHIQRQFERRSVGKTYRAQVFGVPPASAGAIDLPMRCDWPNRPRQMVDLVLGKSAQTSYRVMHTTALGAMVELTPISGRSHQLRVHMQALGTPICGDKFYAEGLAFSAAPRLLLHAESLRLQHPTSGVELKFHCPAEF
jgi:tRNA pseudouridine32 synthase/23S rRNA pseudouridine746 synthase